MRLQISFLLIVLFCLSIAVGQGPDTSSSGAYLTLKEMDQIKAHLNKNVSISGVCDEFRSSWSPTAPNIISLREGDQTLEIVYWDNNGEKISADFTKKGTPVYVTGLAQNYRGRLQIKVEDNSKLSTTPLTDQQINQPSQPSASANSPAQKPRKQQWVPFDDDQALESLETYGYALVYVRSSKNPLCKKFETDFLLHPEAEKMISSDKMFFISVDALDGATLAKELDITQSPALLVLKPKFRRSVFVYTQNTTGVQVAEFLSQL